ncbi:MAG: PBECR4 domain-containing protein [Eubacterium sp.]|nr:PBECR4 domain-containing protein [Eubacterium sp.]
MKPQIHRIIKLTETQLILKLHTAALMYSIYEACLNGTIKIEDCSPTHSLNNMYEKISVINNLLDFKHSKCYRIGEKNLITKDNDFELATGNSSGVIGYDHRISQKGSKKLNRNINAMPTTLLATPITQLVSNPEKIMFILQKPIQEKRYQKILYEIKKGLLRENYSLLPRNIQNSICCYNSEF